MSVDVLEGVEASSGSWEDALDPTVIAAIGALPGNERRGLRFFLTWLTTRPPDSVDAHVWEAFNRGADLVFPGNPLGHQRAFVDTFQAWIDSFLADPKLKLKKLTRENYADEAKKSLETLARQGFQGIPPSLSPRWFTVGRTKSDPTPTLGEALSSWEELSGYQGYAREQKALNLIRNALVDEFQFWDNLFQFGQSLLQGAPTPPGMDPKARADIRNILLLVKETIREKGTTSIGKHRGTPAEALGDPDLWLRAGGIDLQRLKTPKKHSRLKSNRNFSHLACVGCLGPTRPAAASAIGIVICDTGWNVQPTLDLPRNPFVFTSMKSAFLASANFIQSYKNKASHHVMAFLDDNRIDEETRFRKAQEIWDETVNEYDPAELQDGYAKLEQRSEELSTIAVLNRFRVMSNALRADLGLHFDPRLADAFWVAFTVGNPRNRQWHGKVGLAQQTSLKSVLNRPDVTPMAIRKTTQVLRYQDNQSVGAGLASAGHITSGVLMPHYLNTSVVNAQLDASIRQFQDAFVAVVMRDYDQERIALTLGTTVENLQQMRQVAEDAGLTAALGFVDEAVVGDGPTLLYFKPTNAGLRDLYLLHRAFRRMQATYTNRSRFRQVYLPLFALVKALGAEVFYQHLGPQYWRVAREAEADLRRGTISLPYLED